MLTRLLCFISHLLKYEYPESPTLLLHFVCTAHIGRIAYHCRCLFTSACNCDSVGGISGGECEGKTDPAEGLVAGRCMCKTNVQGIRCNLCKPGYWNLQSTNADGCEGTL